MNRIIDWFRKPAIMKKLYLTGGDWDGDLVVYKHHRYYVNIQTGVVMRIEQHTYNYIYIFQSFKLILVRRCYSGRCNTYSKIHLQEA